MGRVCTSVAIVDPAEFVTQRRARRQPLEGAAVLVSEEGPFENPGHDVWVFDISLTGIGFRSGKLLAVGSVHRIHVNTPTVKMVRKVRITRCDRRDSKFDVGAVFLDD